MLQVLFAFSFSLYRKRKNLAYNTIFFIFLLNFFLFFFFVVDFSLPRVVFLDRKKREQLLISLCNLYSAFVNGTNRNSSLKQIELYIVFVLFGREIKKKNLKKIIHRWVATTLATETGEWNFRPKLKWLSLELGIERISLNRIAGWIKLLNRLLYVWVEKWKKVHRKLQCVCWLS